MLIRTLQLVPFSSDFIRIYRRQLTKKNVKCVQNVYFLSHAGVFICDVYHQRITSESHKSPKA